GRRTVRGGRVDERAPFAHRASDLSPAGEKPRRRGAGGTLPPPEPGVPTLGELLSARDSGPPAASALAPGGRARAREHARDGAGREARSAGRIGSEGADGRDTEGTRRAARRAERRLLSRLRTAYAGGVSQSNLGRPRSASAMCRPHASRSW